MTNFWKYWPLLQTVKIDINIETDLAYALKVKECPQLLFLKGNKILYREKGWNHAIKIIFFYRISIKSLSGTSFVKLFYVTELRTADELVHMIAHFYYNAKKPSWVDAAAVAPPF